MKLSDQEITNIIDTFETLVCEDLRSVDMEALYDDMLDECYSFDSVGGPFAYQSPSSVLKRVDPVAYNCGMLDWLNGESCVEIDGDYYEKREVEAIRDNLVSDLESLLSDLEDEKSAEIEALKDSASADPDRETPDRIVSEDRAEIEATFAEKRKLIEEAIATLNKHTF